MILARRSYDILLSFVIGFVSSGKKDFVVLSRKKQSGGEVDFE